jgi:hypothetical protein
MTTDVVRLESVFVSALRANAVLFAGVGHRVLAGAVFAALNSGLVIGMLTIAGGGDTLTLEPIGY